MKNNRIIICLCLIILNILSILSIYSSLHQAQEFKNKELLYKQILALLILLSRIFSSLDTQKIFLKKIIFPLILVGINFFLIFHQPDLGTALICLFLFFFVGFSSRLKKVYLIIPLVSGILLSPLAWHFLKDYQKKRLLVFLNPNMEPQGAGYTIIQSKIAIGSGRFFG
ncbi:MAG: hypothetical protein B6D55_05910, partial [Candidatus Omnitrophica bacterium 4484_70.2]